MAGDEPGRGAGRHSQIKINVTNAYSGSLAWTNCFTRVTKTYPGRMVFLA